MSIAFWIISLVTVVGAVLAVTLRNLVHCVLSLVLFFLGLAAHYFLLRADFLGAVQILIYVGAVAVLILFAIMLTRNVTGREGPPEAIGGPVLAGAATALLAGALLVMAAVNDPLAGATLKGGFDSPLVGLGATQPPGAGVGTAVAEIGRLLVTDWVVPLEVLAVLLTAALVGAVVIALEDKEKGGRR